MLAQPKKSRERQPPSYNVAGCACHARPGGFVQPPVPAEPQAEEHQRWDWHRADPERAQLQEGFHQPKLASVPKLVWVFYNFIRRLHFVEVLWGSSMHFVDKTWSNMIKLYWISQFHLHLIHSHYAMICIYIAKVQREEARWTGSGEKWACLPDKSKPVGPLEGPCSSGTKGYAASRIPTREADDSWPWNIRTFFHLFSSLLCLFRAARWSLNVHEHAM